jgi:chemosensory pili system protein ChpA (sensor histidine kinase/response regulator)
MDDQDGERQQMMEVFLLEAWETLAAIEELLLSPCPAAGRVDRLLVLTHRLRGSAALYGLADVSALGRAMEQLLEAPASRAAGTESAAREALGTLASQLRGALEAAGAGASGGRAAGDGAPAPAAAAAPAGSPGDLREEVRRFFADNGEILAYFAPEAAEHLDTMLNALLLLEQEGPNEDALTRLFRAVHTLKGAAYTVGFAAAGRLAHGVEDVLAAVRDERVRLTPPVTEAVLAGIEALKALLAGPEALRDDLAALVDRAHERLRSASAPVPGAAAAPPPPPEPLLPAAASAPPDAMRPPAPRDGVPGETPDDPGEGTSRRVRETSAPARPSIRVGLDRLDALMSLVGELVIARSRLERRLTQLERVGDLLAFSRHRIGQVARDLEVRELEPAPQGPARARDGDTGPAPEAGGPPGESLSQLLTGLGFERYDDTAILARATAEIAADISEVQTQLAALIQHVSEETAQIQRLTGGLRNEVTRARMVPLGTLFGRFALQVREAARSAGKRVALQVSGESVEVDNSIVQQLADPLLHLVRNAVAHGIEPEEERRRRGKPLHGSVSLHAYHQGGAIYVEVEDDGRGMDAATLKAHAVRHGFLTPDAAAVLSDREALELIFLPGFTTSTQVTSAAGRGVGMDAVRASVARLNGEIGVETAAGVGTRFTIKLPLTVIIADALFVRVGNERLAIPLTAVRMIRTASPAEVHRAGRAEMVRVEGELIDLLRLDRLLELPPAAPRGRTPVVVLRSAGRSIAVAVDELLGKEEIVIKSLGGFLEGLGPFAGATISGEGSVILLLDAARLAEAAPEPASALQRGPAAAGAPAPRGPGAEAAPRVLLVDDSVSVRKFVGQMLQRAGFEVVTATDGADALERVADSAVHAVITDLEMPRLNGYELIEELRRRPSTRDIPVVVLTTRAGGKHLGLARRLGVQHYVTKPAEEQALAQAIRSLVAARDAVPRGTGH